MEVENNIVDKFEALELTNEIIQSMKNASKSPSEMRDIAARICRDYLTGAWKSISAEDIKLKRISGGLSNFLYYVSLTDNNDNSSPRATITSTTGTRIGGNKRPRKDSFSSILEPKEVLLRIYGQTHGEHALETMLTESVVFTLLSERKLGPKLHGIFPGGRIEQYIPARALLTSELSDPKISYKIAEKMGEIHSLDIPISKEPDWLWKTIDRWLKNVENILNKFNSNNPVEMELVKELRKINFVEEVKWFKRVVQSQDFLVVFSHNDLQEGNILYREDCSSPIDNSSSFEQLEDSGALDSHFESILITSELENSNTDININYVINNSRKRLLDNSSIENDLDSTRDSVLSSQTFSETAEPELMIIDFEYCSYNYRGFDLANHFLEWTFDYTNSEHPYFYHKKEQYPTIDQKEQFISAYLTKLSNSPEYIPTRNEIDEILHEISCFTMASHLFWTLWAIVNVYQDIEFGYWEYANCRIKEYYLAKEFYIKVHGQRELKSK